MIATALILGAGMIIGGLLATFWNEILDYVKKVITKVGQMIQNTVLGIRVALRKTSDGIIQLTKNYSQDQETKRWKETIVRRTLDENAVPKDKRERLTMEEEFDITDEFELALQG